MPGTALCRVTVGGPSQAEPELGGVLLQKVKLIEGFAAVCCHGDLTSVAGFMGHCVAHGRAVSPGPGWRR